MTGSREPWQRPHPPQCPHVRRPGPTSAPPPACVRRLGPTSAPPSARPDCGAHDQSSLRTGFRKLFSEHASSSPCRGRTHLCPRWGHQNEVELGEATIFNFSSHLFFVSEVLGGSLGGAISFTPFGIKRFQTADGRAVPKWDLKGEQLIKSLG